MAEHLRSRSQSPRSTSDEWTDEERNQYWSKRRPPNTGAKAVTKFGPPKAEEADSWRFRRKAPLGASKRSTGYSGVYERNPKHEDNQIYASTSTSRIPTSSTRSRRSDSQVLSGPPTSKNDSTISSSRFPEPSAVNVHEGKTSEQQKEREITGAEENTPRDYDAKKSESEGAEKNKPRDDDAKKSESEECDTIDHQVRFELQEPRLDPEESAKNKDPEESAKNKDPEESAKNKDPEESAKNKGSQLPVLKPKPRVVIARTSSRRSALKLCSRPSAPSFRSTLESSRCPEPAVVGVLPDSLPPEPGNETGIHIRNLQEYENFLVMDAAVKTAVKELRGMRSIVLRGLVLSLAIVGVSLAKVDAAYICALAVVCATIWAYELTRYFPGRELDSEVRLSNNTRVGNHIELDLQAMEEIEMLGDTLGQFSYYVIGGQIVVHAEDEEAKKNKDRLKASIEKISQKCAKVKVTTNFVTEPVDVELCSPKIGARLNILERSNICGAANIRERPQQVGMYIKYNGIVFWVSAAHNYIPCIPGNEYLNHQLKENALMHSPLSENSKICQLETFDSVLGDVGRELIMAPTPYACWIEQPLNRMGQVIRHSVDIMIGPVPLVAAQVEAGRPIEHVMSEVRGPCPLCDTYVCNHPDRQQSELRYAVHDWQRFETQLDETYVRYIVDSLLADDCILSCLVSNQKVARGRVVSCQTSLQKSGAYVYRMRNQLFIRPLNDSRPEVGDSGSVWVSEKDNKAVAMTVGRIRTLNVWVAQLLHPCFEAFYAAHRHSFVDFDGIRSLTANA